MKFKIIFDSGPAGADRRGSIFSSIKSNTYECVTALVTARGYLARRDRLEQTADRRPGARAARGPRAVEAGLLAELEAACARAAARSPRCSRSRCAWWCRRARCASRRAARSCARGRARVGRARPDPRVARARGARARGGVGAAVAALRRGGARARAPRARARARSRSARRWLCRGVRERRRPARRGLHRAARGAAARARGRGGERIGAARAQRALLRVAAQVVARARRADARASLARARARERPAARGRARSCRRARSGSTASPTRRAFSSTCSRRSRSASTRRVWLDRAGAPRRRVRRPAARAARAESPVCGRGAAVRRAHQREPPRRSRVRGARGRSLGARAASDAGIAPERIAIVARDLARHRLALRRQLAPVRRPVLGRRRARRDHAGRTPARRALRAARARRRAARRALARRPRRRASRAPRRAPICATRCTCSGSPRSPTSPRRAPASWRDGVPLRARTGLALDARGRAARAAAVGRRATGSPRCARPRSRRCATSRPSPRARRSPRAPRASPSSSSALGWSPDTPGHAELAAAVAAFERAGDRPLRRDDWHARAAARARRRRHRSARRPRRRRAGALGDGGARAQLRRACA